MCPSERLIPGTLQWKYWTGHINPEKATCTGCQDEVNLASSGDYYNTTVHPNHRVKYNTQFCGMFGDNYGIEGDGCNTARRYACEFTCHKERKHILYFMRLRQ